MRLVLDPAEEAAHGEWLRRTPGAYEWWYFDALSDSGEWAVSCIWFLGNPFSPYYRQSALGLPADPYAENAFFFALYRHGRLHAYHFTRFSPADITAAESMPLCLGFGPNTLLMTGPGQWRLEIADENANGRRLTAALSFAGPPLVPDDSEESLSDTDHSWLPVAPFCRVGGEICLREPHNPGLERIAFTGTGYHDHNWGRLPFDAAIRDWYWARAALSSERSVILYHVRPRRGPAVSHLLLFERGRLTRHAPSADVRLSRPVLTGFGTRYFSSLSAAGAGFEAGFRLGTRLDSAPFYLRTLCDATVTLDGRTESGRGLGEYLRPRPMSWPLVASAMKARIVER